MTINVTPIPRLIDLAAPAFTLGTANAAGSAATAVASDSTLLAFDTTLPDAITYGQSGAVGSATTASHRDHAHAMATGAKLFKTASDQTITNSTTLVNVPGFVFDVAADEVWDVVIYGLSSQLADGGLSVLMVLPSGASFIGSSIGWIQHDQAGTMVGNGNQTGQFSIVAGGYMAVAAFIAHYTITISSTAGTAQWQITQQVSHGTGSILKVGTVLIASQIA